MTVKIFVHEILKAYSIEDQSLTDLSISYPVLKNMLAPISDKRIQVLTGCQYSLSTKDDLCLFIRLHSAIKILVGGYMLLAEKAWRLETQDTRPLDQFYQNADFQSFLRDGRFEKALNGRKLNMNGSGTTHGAVKLIIEHSKYIADQLFKPELEKNIIAIINATDDEVLENAQTNIEQSTSTKNTFIKCKIKDQEDIFIQLANTEEEQELFKEWLADPMIDRRSTGNEEPCVFVFNSIEVFYEWLNYFRLKITSHFCYETLLGEMKRLYDGDEADKRITSLNRKLESFGGSLSTNSQKFKNVIDYCDGILMGANKKDFIFLDQENLPITPDRNGNYIYNLYM